MTRNDFKALDRRLRHLASLAVDSTNAESYLDEEFDRLYAGGVRVDGGAPEAPGAMAYGRPHHDRARAFDRLAHVAGMRLNRDIMPMIYPEGWEQSARTILAEVRGLR